MPWHQYPDGMAVSYDLLRTFLGVYRSGSVTRAAAALGLSQPAVTAQIRALEKSLGRELFDRLPRGMAPTVAADELARRVADPLDALAARVGEDLGDGGAVHLAGPAELVCTRVLPALAPLVAEGLRMRVTFGLTDPLLAGLGEGAYDLVIATRRPRSRGLASDALCDEEFVLVAAADRRGGYGDAPLVAYADNLPILRRYWRTVFGTRLTRTAALVVPDLRGVLAAVLAGAGVSALPRYLCEAELADGRLRVLAEPEVPPINTLFVAYRPGAARAAVGRVREELLRVGRGW